MSRFKFNLFKNINANDIPESFRQNYLDYVSKINEVLDSSSDKFNCPEKIPLFGNKYYNFNALIRLIVSEEIEDKYYYYIWLDIGIDGYAYFECGLQKFGSYNFNFGLINLNDDNWDCRLLNCYIALDRLLWEVDQ